MRLTTRAFTWALMSAVSEIDSGVNVSGAQMSRCGKTNLNRRTTD